MCVCFFFYIPYLPFLTWFYLSDLSVVPSQVPGVGACVRRRVIWLPGEERQADPQRGQEVLQTNNLRPWLLPQSLHMVCEKLMTLWGLPFCVCVCVFHFQFCLLLLLCWPLYVTPLSLPCSLVTACFFTENFPKNAPPPILKKWIILLMMGYYKHKPKVWSDSDQIAQPTRN